MIPERKRRKPKLAVWKFTGCDGCQLTLLDCEDELLTIAGEMEIAHFLEATKAEVRGPYDLSLIEGSISTPHEIEQIREVRRQSKFLVSIGACATAGGIQALRNFANVKEFMQLVYAKPEYVQTLDTSLPPSAYVTVDFELRGCSPSKAQIVELISAFLQDRHPNISKNSLCIDCKRKGIVCIMVAQGIPCLGPVTQVGCGVLCPSHNRGCYGCFGPMETPNTVSMNAWLTRLGVSPARQVRLYRTYNANTPEFKEASERYAAEEAAEATHDHNQG